MTARPDRVLVERVRSRLELDPSPDPQPSVERHLADLIPLASPPEQSALAAAIGHELFGLGALHPYFDDDAVDEVLVNAGTDVWIERAGQLHPAGTLAPGEVDQIVERILRPLGVRLDRTHPAADARLPDGSRVCAVIPPLAPDGTTVAIRRFRPIAHGLEDFAPHEATIVLRELVRARCNVLVSGATSAGKTSLLNALGSALPAGERIVTIEDTAELRLPGDHVVRLECRTATSDGPAAVGVRALVRLALRLRPDRLVVGEVRGAEALDMLQALSTGHDGSLSTCHANGAEDALVRIETMAVQDGGEVPLAVVRDLVHRSFDAVVHVARGSRGLRQVVEIAEVAPSPGAAQRIRTVWRPGETAGTVGRGRR